MEMRKANPFAGGLIALVLAAPVMVDAEPEVLTRAKNKAKAFEQGEQEATAHGGANSFRLSSVEGYPGMETAIFIADKYHIYEDGEEKKKPINKVRIDWGDGETSTSFAGAQQNHQYGTRHEDGATWPRSNTQFTGKITFLTTDGGRYTEQFDYEVWVDRRGSLARGGRKIPSEALEPVWCMSGSIGSDGVCTERFEIEQTVFEFEGCYDHNVMQFPVLGGDVKTYDVRGIAKIVRGRYDQGWHVQPHKNEIAADYGPSFKVINLDSRTNSSGIYYRFNPINPGPSEAGTTVESFSIDSVSIDWDYFNNTFAVPVDKSIRRQPSTGSPTAQIRMEDPGASGGYPPCPRGPMHSGYAWVELGIKAVATGTIRSVKTSGDEPSLPSGYHHNKNYQDYMDDPRGGGEE